MKKYQGRFLFLLWLLATSSFALEQHTKLWLAVNIQKPITEDKKWQYNVLSQFRFIDESHPWQTAFLEGSVGYELLEGQLIWLGYRWSGHNPNNRFYQENRLIQQFTWKLIPYNIYQYSTRTRLEEIERTNENQIALRFRQRLAVEIRQSMFAAVDVFPYFTEEVFLQLNATNFTPHRLFSENRFFLGVNIYQSKKTWWEVGYMNQYQIRSPTQNENQMSHIFSIMLNFH